MMSWTLSLRDEKGRLHTLELEKGSTTSVLELKREVSKASKAPLYKQVWKAGFPPKIVLAPNQQRPPSVEIGTFLSNRERIVLELATEEQLKGASNDRGPAHQNERGVLDTPSTPPAPPLRRDEAEAPAEQRSAQNDNHRDLGEEAEGSGSVAEHAGRTDPAQVPAAAATPEESPSRKRPAAPSGPMVLSAGVLVPKRPPVKRHKRLHFPGSAHTLEGGSASEAAAAPKGDLIDAMRGAEDGALGALLQAARGGSKLGDALGQDWSPGNQSIFKALRQDLRSARTALGNETIANDKVAAVRGGKVTFRELGDGTGRIEATWMSGRKELKECVPGIPVFVLAAVLISLFHDEDANARDNLQPLKMAQVSPRVFWALARHGKVGPECTFGEALKKIVPSLDWDKLDIDHRDRRRPERYAEFVAH